MQCDVKHALWTEATLGSIAKVWLSMQAGNVADPLRYAFIVSQAELAANEGQVATCSYSNRTDIEGVGVVSVGVSKADGHKCAR